MRDVGFLLDGYVFYYFGFLAEVFVNVAYSHRTPKAEDNAKNYQQYAEGDKVIFPYKDGIGFGSIGALDGLPATKVRKE